MLFKWFWDVVSKCSFKGFEDVVSECCTFFFFLLNDDFLCLNFVVHVYWMGICHVIFVHVGFCEPFIKTVWAFCVPCVPSIILGCGLGDDKNIVSFLPYMRTLCIFPNVSRVGSDIGFSNEFSSHFTSFIVHLVPSCLSGVTEMNIESQWLKY